MSTTSTTSAPTLKIELRWSERLNAALRKRFQDYLALLDAAPSENVAAPPALQQWRDAHRMATKQADYLYRLTGSLAVVGDYLKVEECGKVLRIEERGLVMTPNSEELTVLYYLESIGLEDSEDGLVVKTL